MNYIDSQTLTGNYSIRQDASSPDVHIYFEGDNEDEQIEVILNQGKPGDFVQYISNNQEGFRQFRIVRDENPDSPNYGTLYLEEIHDTDTPGKLEDGL